MSKIRLKTSLYRWDWIICSTHDADHTFTVGLGRERYVGVSSIKEHNLGILLVTFFDLYGRKLNNWDVGISCNSARTIVRKQRVIKHAVFTLFCAFVLLQHVVNGIWTFH